MITADLIHKGAVGREPLAGSDADSGTHASTALALSSSSDNSALFQRGQEILEAFSQKKDLNCTKFIAGSLGN